MVRKRDFQEPRLILHSFYVHLLLINLVYSHNLRVWPKIKLQLRFTRTRAYKSRIGSDGEKTWLSRDRS